MAINTLSKNSIGVVITLLLVILLSESRLFKIITDTYLGRTLLVTILLFASYLNKILGVVCVFVIIIMFSIMKFTYEGFENEKESDKKDEKETTKPEVDKGVEQTTTTSNTISTPINTATPVPNDSKENTEKINIVTTSSANKSDADATTKSIEGFDLQTTENIIRRGKQSNSIPISQYNNQSIEVSPYEGPSFSNLFGLLQ